jgi:Glycosyl hydrolases family 2
MVGPRLFTGRVKSPQLWGLENPVLYEVEVTLDGRKETAWKGFFGFRKFETRDGKFYLNGEPIYIISALDQDFCAARALLTTFRLAEAYGKDEYARRLLDEMIRLVSAEGFEPKLTIE